MTLSQALLTLICVAAVAHSAPQPPVAAAPAEDGNWTMPGKNFAATRFSDLAELNADNVTRLQVAFTFSTGVTRGQEAAPLVHGDRMYLLTAPGRCARVLTVSRELPLHQL